MDKVAALSKARELATQWKDRALNKNKPKMPSIAQIAQQAMAKEKKRNGPAAKGPKVVAPPPLQRKPFIAEQAKEAAYASKKHLVQVGLRRQRQYLDL